MHSFIHLNEKGRTLLEVLAVIAVIGIISVSGLQLYSKAMVQIRTNDITNEASKLFAARDEKRIKHKTFDLGTKDQDKTPYGYDIVPPKTKCKNKIMVEVGKITDGNAIDSKVCKNLFKFIKGENSPIKGIYKYNECAPLNVDACSDSDKIAALDFEFATEEERKSIPPSPLTPPDTPATHEPPTPPTPPAPPTPPTPDSPSCSTVDENCSECVDGTKRLKSGYTAPACYKCGEDTSYIEVVKEDGKTDSCGSFCCNPATEVCTGSGCCQKGRAYAGDTECCPRDLDSEGNCLSEEEDSDAKEEPSKEEEEEEEESVCKAEEILKSYIKGTDYDFTSPNTVQWYKTTIKNLNLSGCDVNTNSSLIIQGSVITRDLSADTLSVPNGASLKSRNISTKNLSSSNEASLAVRDISAEKITWYGNAVTITANDITLNSEWIMNGSKHRVTMKNLSAPEFIIGTESSVEAKNMNVTDLIVGSYATLKAQNIDIHNLTMNPHATLNAAKMVVTSKSTCNTSSILQVNDLDLPQNTQVCKNNL